MILALQISLFTCGLAIMLDYKQGEPKRYQMLLYFIMKPIIDYRNKVESEYQSKLKKANNYYNAAIKGLEAVSDKGEPIYTQAQKEKKLLHWLELQEQKQTALELDKESKLAYEWYLKPIILCVYCMPSFWGSIIWVGFNGFNNPFEYGVTLISSVFINAVIWNIYLKYDNQ